MSTPEPPVVIDGARLTPAWVGAALGGRVDAVRAEKVGTGQIGTCYRLALEGPDVGTTLPARVLVKLPAPDQGSRDMLAGAYRGELRFYDEIAPTVSVRIPEIHYAAMAEESSEFTLLMQDLAPLVQGDQLRGCTVDQARDAVVNLAGLHGPRWCDPTLEEIENLAVSGPDDAQMLADLYGPATDIFVDGLGPLLGEDDVATLRECVEVTYGWALARPERYALVHGDYRLDNLMFPPDGGPGVVAVDWQTLSLGLPARDLAYFVATGLPTETRRTCERDLVAAYHAALTTYGVEGYSLEACWEDYRFAMVQGPLVAVFGCAYGARTDRGDQMFATMVRRSCAAIRDLDTIRLAKEA